MKLNGSVSLWFKELCILHHFLVIVFNLKLDAVHVLQPSQFIIFHHFFLSYYLCKLQKYGLTCLNYRIKCNYRIINQFTGIQMVFSISVHIHVPITLILDEMLE